MISTRFGKDSEKGTEIIEFVLIVGFILLPLLLGVVVVGINLGREVQVTQIARDAGSMYVRGVDFSQSGNQDVLVRLGQGLALAKTGGSGVVILSEVSYIPAGGCTTPCNQAQYVIVQRIVVGDSTLVAAHGQIQSSGPVSLDVQGNVINYVTDTNAVISGFGNILTLNGNEFAYVAESYFPTPNVDTLGYIGTGVYSRSIY